MKTQFLLPALLSLIILFGIGACTGTENVRTVIPEPPIGGGITEKPQPRFLIFMRENHVDETEFIEMLDIIFGPSNYDRATTPNDMDLLAPGLVEQYAALLFYDSNHPRPPREELYRLERFYENFDQLLQNGMPILVLHHGVGNYPRWAKFREIAGGAYIFPGVVSEYEDLHGRSWGPSHYEHDVYMNITVVDRDHPITQGIDDFVIFDEAYKDIYVYPGVHVLLTTDFPEATPAVAWVHRYSNSPVFTLSLGHDKHAYTNENFRRLIRQGIDWLISERRK